MNHALPGLRLSNDAKRLLIGFADGDARRLLNLLEQTKVAAETEKIVDINADYVRNVFGTGRDLSLLIRDRALLYAR